MTAPAEPTLKQCRDELRALLADVADLKRRVAVEDHGDELVVRRPDWVTDGQWTEIRRALEAQGWEAVARSAS